MRIAALPLGALLLAGFATLQGPDPASWIFLPDAFHPGRRPHADGTRAALPEPALGGRVRVHVPVLPRSLNAALESSTVGRRMLLEVHESLLRRDWDTLEHRPSVAESMVVEDALVLSAEGARAHPGRTLFVPPPIEELSRASDAGGARVLAGRVTAVEGGFRVEPLAVGNPLPAAIVVPAHLVEGVERGTIFTFDLRRDVLWHDGHPFDAEDVLFSWSLYRNPHVRCDAKRFQYLKLARAEALSRHRVRFVYQEQYFKARDAFVSLCLLPAHRYDLLDPDHPEHDPAADLEARAAAIHENEANTAWIGLGPYRVTRFDERGVAAERFADYFDRERAGYLDRLEWRAFASDEAAAVALVEGELDFTDRLPADLYLGDFVRDESFRRSFYAGYLFRGRYGFVTWNLHDEVMQERAVRLALARAVDLEAFLAALYPGLAVPVTGSMYRFGPAYDPALLPSPLDLDGAEELLAEAGWLDRDGDGLLDRDGEDLAIELLVPAGNQPSQRLGQHLQENLARLGVQLELRALDVPALVGRVRARDYQGALLAISQPLEGDPEQLWHSRWGGPEDLGTSNLAGFQDERADRFIERGQRTLDDAERHRLWHELQALVYAEQPFLFLYNAASPFAVRKDLRGVQAVRADPNYVLRRWYFSAGYPGTRPVSED